MEKIRIHVFLRILILLTIFFRINISIELKLNFEMFVAVRLLSITVKLPMIMGV